MTEGTPSGGAPNPAEAPSGPIANGAGGAAATADEPSGPRHYWQAAGFASTLLAEFEAGRRVGDGDLVRERFYVLARYFRRTLAIVHAAIDERDEPLAGASLRNILVLQGTLATMHRADPDAAPTTLSLEPALHRRVNRDLVHRILRDARSPLGADGVLRRFNELDAIGDARLPAITASLRALVAAGHATAREGRYLPSDRPYVDVNAERAALAMLVGPALAGALGEHSFEGLSDALDRPAEFRVRFTSETGFGAETASLVLACAAAIEAPVRGLTPASRWPHADLTELSWPRPYQRMIQAIFRAHGYAGQVVEAPNGSGKTMIGMLCIDDWLGELAPGQSILVLVPTVNYEQQWLGELCLKPIGLRLPPHLVYAGTPSGLERLVGDGGALPAIIVTTYPALARAVSGLGKGGFDRGAIERFLQGYGIRHVILDEVHKVALDLDSPTAECVRVLLDWLHDGSLGSVIGFSGTLLELQPQLAQLGLELVYVLPPAELIGQGWVAPFTELGVPFNYSERERQIVALLEQYRALLLDYLDALGGTRLRTAFASVPLADRVRVATAMGMYGGRPETEAQVRARLTGWEAGEDLGLAELPMVVILQAVRGWSDAALALEAGAAERMPGWLAAFDDLRARLRPLLPPGRLQRRLDVTAFGTALDAGAIATNGSRPASTARRAKDILASTFAGLYLGLRDWSRQAGEGRVDAVRSVIEVEREARPVSGVIVFDNPGPLDWREGLASPGYRGAGGLYLQLLADPASTPVAALATELYLPDRELPERPGSGLPGRPLHEEIAGWIVDAMIRRELGGALLALLAAGVPGEQKADDRLRATLDGALERYCGTVLEPDRARMEVFSREVLGPVRELTRAARRGSALREALALPSLDAHHPHLRSIARAMFDYARLARAFRDAVRVEAVRADGIPCPVRVIPMPGGDRRQRMYDLVGRMVDAPELPIDVVVVTSWARTGWNVTTPNVLIDATATRDVIAWQQLRGRAMRPWTSWTGDDQQQVQRLLACEDEPPDRREHQAATLMLAHNKAAHIYELVRSYGAAAQVVRHRRDGDWERADAIAAKHRREWSVRATDGAYIRGPEHAPLLIKEDPRRDTPAMLRERLRAELAVGDEPVVRGWLRAAAAIASAAAEDAAALGS